MRNILNEADYRALCNRIQSLSAASNRLWGKMDLPQMLVHCTTQLKLAAGEIPSQKQGPFIMRTRFGKWMLFSNIPWPRGAQTPNEMNTALSHSSFADIESGKNNLLYYLEKIKVREHLEPHPFFGKLTRKEWARLIYKHLDHHLKQFSCP